MDSKKLFRIIPQTLLTFSYNDEQTKSDPYGTVNQHSPINQPLMHSHQMKQMIHRPI